MHTRDMNTAAITLSQTASRIAVIVNGQTLGTVKDGGQIVKNADRILKAAKVLRATGYSLGEDGVLVASGVVL